MKDFFPTILNKIGSKITSLYFQMLTQTPERLSSRESELTPRVDSDIMEEKPLLIYVLMPVFHQDIQ